MIASPDDWSYTKSKPVPLLTITELFAVDVAPTEVRNFAMSVRVLVTPLTVHETDHRIVEPSVGLIATEGPIYVYAGDSLVPVGPTAVSSPLCVVNSMSVTL